MTRFLRFLMEDILGLYVERHLTCVKQIVWNIFLLNFLVSAGITVKIVRIILPFFGTIEEINSKNKFLIYDANI